MAQINFNSIQSSEGGQANNSGVSFFSLKNDNDEAIVRFVHDTVESFELLTTHDISFNGKFRKVNCIRNPQEPLENCPLCASGKDVKQRIFIHLVQYVQDEHGNIVALPKVWDRPITYAYKLKSLIDEYGPLTDSVFKIKRHGAAGSRETSYDILFCNPAMYDSNRFPKNFHAFETYKALGSIVMDKTFDELLSYVTTGEFPEVKRVDNSQQNNYNNVVPNAIPQSYSEVNTNSYSKMGYDNISNTPNTPNIPNTPIRDTMVNGFGNIQTQQAVQRPVRSYNN